MWKRHKKKLRHRDNCKTKMFCFFKEVTPAKAIGQPTTEFWHRIQANLCSVSAWQSVIESSAFLKNVTVLLGSLNVGSWRCPHVSFLWYSKAFPDFIGIASEHDFELMTFQKATKENMACKINAVGFHMPCIAAWLMLTEVSTQHNEWQNLFGFLFFDIFVHKRSDREFDP